VRRSGRIERRAEPPGRGEAGQREAVGCQPVQSSRVPARERIMVVWYKGGEPGDGGRKDRECASHNRQAGNGKGFWDEDQTGTRP